MLLVDIFKVFLYPDSESILDSEDEGEDITSGILNVDIQYGTNAYEGPQEQIDSGQFTIVTRNPNLDPKINPNLKYNSAIKFWDERSGEFFRGYVTDVQVEYQRKDNPIITIIGTDIFGMMQSYLITKEIQDEIMSLSSEGWGGVTFTDFLSYITDFTGKYLNLDIVVPGNLSISNGFWFDSSQSFIQKSESALLDYAPAQYIPQVGETYLDVINKYAQTNLTSFSARGDFNYQAITVYSFPKYNPYVWPSQQDPMLTYTTYDFSSDANDDKSYETILIDNGYNRVISQLDISNEYTSVNAGVRQVESQNLARISDESIQSYLVSAASISTIYPENAQLDINLSDWADGYSKNVFQVTLSPTQEIEQITFNNARYEDIENNFSYSDYDLNRMIRIKHQINDTETIDKVYDISGVRHNINVDRWEMGFNLKPSAKELIFNYQGQIPTIEMNSLSGDSNFNFTATITDFPTETIDKVIWCLNGTNINVEEQWAISGNGTRYKNSLQRNGLSQTWNFDDDGILADVPNGGYGTGQWYVIPYIILNTGWVIAPNVMLTVGTPAVEARFTWEQNLTNNFGQVAFTDDSRNNETGEVDSYLWDFGDGNTSSLQNPVHQYDPSPSTTTYSTSLTVFAYGDGGVKVYNTDPQTVTLVQPAMTANFTFIQTPYTGLVTFTDTSVNVGFEEADAYLWDFGDGTTSTLKNPSHIFVSTENVPITYSVSLTVRNIWEQTASVTKSVIVNALNDAGSLSVSNLRLTIDNYNTVTPSPNVPKYPYMIFLRARTSYTQANLVYLAQTSRTGTTSNVVWYEADGTTAEAVDPYNLTRDPAITPTSQYGLSPWINNTTSQSTKFVLNTDVNNSQNIKNIQMTLRDIDSSGSGGATQNPIVNVDVPDSFGGYVNIGYFKVPAGKINPSVPFNVVSEGLKTMIPRRPMPPNIPYFKYTFDNLTASFQSMETADSYAWTFGDGTTSTSQNPTKTFSSRGTYNVTLAVTTGGIVTRTTTEPVIVEAIAPFDVRYVKFEQNEHDGTHAFDTPWLANFKMKNIQDSLNSYIVYTSGAPYEALEVGKTVAKEDFYSMQYTPSDGSFSFNPTTNPYWFRLMNSDDGLRVKSLDAGFLTKWNLICDFRQAWKNVSDFTVDVALANISPNPTVASGISYSVYVTNHTGSTIDPNAVTWTKVGDITPTAMTQLAKTYSIVPS
jgi:PKD repeat protein